jgi:tryptophan synthase beta chain
MGIFTAFLNDAGVQLVGVEPAGEGVDKPGRHAATLSVGKPGEIHGMKCYVLENADGTPAAVHSIASGLDYPGVGPQHSYLKDLGRVQYQSVTDKECLNAFMTLSRVEGIIPALESAHAVAWAMRQAPSWARTSIFWSTCRAAATRTRTTWPRRWGCKHSAAILRTIARPGRTHPGRWLY